MIGARSTFKIGKNSMQIQVLKMAYEHYHYDCIAPTFKSDWASIMVWRAFTAFTKCDLVLIPLEKCKALDFVDVVYELALEPFYYHDDNYEHLILMEDGAQVHSSCIVLNWREQIGLQKLQWPAN